MDQNKIDNKSFINWCLLCANSENVTLEINELNDEIKENIGMFSVLNFNLPNVPSKICENCFTFLNELEKRKSIYTKAEQMFLELLRSRSRKSIDYNKIRLKYDLIENSLNQSSTLIEDVEVHYIIEESKSNKPEEITTTFIEICQEPEQLIQQSSDQQDNNKLFQCDFCIQSFKTKTLIKNHIEKIHVQKQNLDDDKLFKCDECFKTFKKKGAMKEHKKTHDNVKNHVCSICGKSYKTASTLTQHMDTHNLTKYECQECGLELNTKRTLRQHMLKHSEIMKHVCEFCDSKFKRIKTFKEHLISIHTDIKAYQCEWCDRKFSIGANCRKHKKEKHSKNLEKADKNNEKSSVELPSIEELLRICRERLK